MANETVLREFLVALGFKVDEKGLKNFKTGVEDATKGVVRLVATISGAALTIGAGVSAFASKLEALYFVSKRVGASANNIRALEGAAKDFGVSAESAVGSVENLARMLRNVPGSEGILNDLGVKTRDANGNLRDTVDLLSDLGTELAKKPQSEANAYAGVFQMDENLALAMRDPAFLQRLQQIRKASENNGMDKAAKDAHGLMETLRKIGRTFENLSVQVEAALQRKIGPQLERFSAWFDAHGEEIANRIAEIAIAVLAAATAMTPALKWLADTFMDLDRATDGWSTKLLLAVGAFKLLGGFGLIGGIWKMVAALRAMAVASTAASAAGAAGGAGAAAGGGLLARMFPWLARLGVGATLLFHSEGLGEGEDEEMARIHGREGKGGSSDAAAFFQRMGWTKEQAAGIVANLNRESQMNPSAVGDGGSAYGIAQWHPDRQANFAKWSGKDIRNSSLMDQLGFVHYELTQGDAKNRRAGALLRASKNAQQAGEIVSRYYERPGAADAEASMRGRAAMSLNNDVKIYVNGSSDPVATARAVGDEQDRVNAGIVRNMGGVMQ